MDMRMFSKESAADLPIRTMARIVVSCFTAPPWNESWDVSSAESILRSFLTDNCRFVVAFDDMDELIMGYGIGMPLCEYADADKLYEMGGGPNSFYIPVLATSPGFRCRGVATNCVRALSDFADQAEYSEVLLRTRVDNEPILRVMGHQGFQRIGEYDAVTGGVRSPRAVFRQQLRFVSYSAFFPWL